MGPPVRARDCSLAASYELTEVVRGLLLRGLDADATGPNNLTAVHAAVSLPGAHVAHSIILESIRLTDYGAVMSKVMDVLVLLLEHGADPNATPANGEISLGMVMDADYWWDQAPHPEYQDEIGRY